MRGKRAKQYRRLMAKFEITFNFREPYQVLVDAQMIQDSERFKMDLVGSLERTLHGKVKPMITQCSMRHLYTLSSILHPQKEAIIVIAKNMERRRCNHHELENPLSTLDCFANVIDPKTTRTNKNRYVVASQDEEVRRYCRTVKGVPLVYVKRSVMVMEPMAESSIGVREGMERGKFRMGLRGKTQAASLKRKRNDSSDAERGHAGNANGDHVARDGEGEEQPLPKRKKIRGPKGPNPLSVKKPRKKGEERIERSRREKNDVVEALNASPKKMGNSVMVPQDVPTNNVVESAPSGTQKPPAKRKRKRKHKTGLLAALGEENDGGDGAVYIPLE